LIPGIIERIWAMSPFFGFLVRVVG
jgi:hypothetical protein